MKKHHQAMELQRQGESSSSASSNNEVAEPSNPTSFTVLDEIILSVLERLLKIPVKTLLKFKSVCKQWLCLIESPYFINCHFKYCLEHPFDRVSLFISAKSSVTHGYFCASLSGGQTTRFSLPNFPYQSRVEHLNGLSLFHSRRNFAYIVNPTSHQVLKLPQTAYFSKFSADQICYFFGFDPVCNDFKVLNTRIITESTPDKRTGCWIFSLKNRSWKKIEPFSPFDMLRLDSNKEGVCTNGVIYILLDHSSEIAAFDLVEEKFSTITLPEAAIPSEKETYYYRHVGRRYEERKFNYPYLLNYNGLLAVVCHGHVLTQSVLELWILQDYQNQVWVMETITLPCLWIDFGESLPVDAIPTGEIMFRPLKLSDQREQITFYDMKTKSFRAVEIILPRGFSALSCKGYVESIWPLRSNC